MIEDDRILQIIKDIKLKATDNVMLATAESCTGGLLSAALTSVDGSSKFFDRGFITYSNSAKEQMLGVERNILTEFGAVSEETAGEMARGCLRQSKADLTISITGIAGPDGGSLQKPVGTVCFGVANISSVNSYTFKFSGNRQEIRYQATIKALDLIKQYIEYTRHERH